MAPLYIIRYNVGVNLYIAGSYILLSPSNSTDTVGDSYR